MQEPETKVVLDTPAGLVTAVATCREGKCERVALDMVPSFVEHLDHPLDVDGLGTISVDVAYGGVYFVLIDAETAGVSITPRNARKMVEIAMQAKKAAREQIAIAHSQIAENQIDYVLFSGREAGSKKVFRNGDIMYPGRVDRSPCGTGTCARLAVMHARGEISKGEIVTFLSTIDSRFEAQVLGMATVAGKSAIIPRISGRAWIYGHYQLGVDPTDPYPLGYTLSDTWGPEI